MIVYTSCFDTFCDLSTVAGDLIEEGLTMKEIVEEIVKYCAKNGVHVNIYDIKMMVHQISHQ